MTQAGDEIFNESQNGPAVLAQAKQKIRFLFLSLLTLLSSQLPSIAMSGPEDETPREEGDLRILQETQDGEVRSLTAEESDLALAKAPMPKVKAKAKAKKSKKKVATNSKASK